MTKMFVEATYKYPVDAVDAKDALDTLPNVVKSKFTGFLVEGKAQIIDQATGKVLLKAKLTHIKKGSKKPCLSKNK